MVLTLEEMGIDVESSFHEVAAGQHELDFCPAAALRTADQLMTAKFAIRTIAKRHGLHATFMPKPKTGVHGSGLHLSFSLFHEGKDVFADKSDEYGLSKEAYYFMGGLMKHISGIAAITNPLVNSYKRLTPGYGAPIYVAWSAKNRSPLIRIPLTGDGIMAIELRCPDSAANPYLALAVCMAAGLDGIKQKIVPPSPVDRNISDLTEEERNAMQITLLPGSLGEAVAELKKTIFCVRYSARNLWMDISMPKKKSGMSISARYPTGRPRNICTVFRRRRGLKMHEQHSDSTSQNRRWKAHPGYSGKKRI